MSLLRTLAAVLLVLVALTLQVSFFSEFAWHGIVPNLVLLVVVGAGLMRGGQFGMILGFAAGVLIDLTPPADHTAGRWALALLLVGYVAGRVRPEASPREKSPPAMTVVATVAGCSVLGTSVFALTGLLLHEDAAGFAEALQIVGVSLVWDVLLTPLVMPGVMAVFRPGEPERAGVR